MEYYAVINTTVKEQYKVCVVLVMKNMGSATLYTVSSTKQAENTLKCRSYGQLCLFFSSDALAVLFSQLLHFKDVQGGWVGGRFVLSTGLKRLEWRPAV